MAYGTLLVERRDDVLEVTLNRPEKLNAVNGVMLAELGTVLEAETAGARALLLTGSGRAFSAGADLTDATLDGGDAGGMLERNFHPVVRALAGLEMPVVAAVEGVAAGAGCSLALCADIVIAGRSARLDMAFVRIGLVPDCGALHTLPRLIGTARARAMMLLGEPVDGATAADWGLIWKAVDDGAAVGEARAVAARLAAGPTLALRLIRHALRDGGAAGLDAALDAERALQSEAAGSADFAEGVAAFREKRPPVFRGE